MGTESKFAFFRINTAANNRRVADALEELRSVGQELSAIEITTEPKQRAGLCLVYEIYARCRTDEAEKRQVEEALGIDLTVSKNKRQKLFNALLKTQLGVDRPMASRMASCLRWARIKKTSVEGLMDFLNENGGVSGCAAKYREWKKSKSPKEAELPSISLVVTPGQLDLMERQKRPFTLRCKWRKKGKELLVRRIGNAIP